jgi:hypothetical protein
MKTKIHKALDLNKLFNSQAQGKLLKKHITFPIIAGIKYDGNYTVIIKETKDNIRFLTSGGHEYDNDEPTIFHDDHVALGVYIAERIGTDGKLGDRTTCALRGPKGKQTAYGHTYMVHDYISEQDYYNGISEDDADDRMDILVLDTGLSSDNVVRTMKLRNQVDLDLYLDKVVKDGYEGLMLKNPYALWKDTKSRTVDMVKYKKRPTADLLCIGCTEGTKKYEGMIGALVLEDSQGRQVSVGSGLTDEDRVYHPDCFIGAVIEIEYEQIIDTYIQPTFIRTRSDKTKEEID